MDEEIIKKVFATISGNKKYFKSRDYIQVVRENPDLMSWLTKPKQILDGKLEQNVSSKDQCYSPDLIKEIISNSNK